MPVKLESSAHISHNYLSNPDLASIYSIDSRFKNRLLFSPVAIEAAFSIAVRGPGVHQGRGASALDSSSGQAADEPLLKG